MNIIGVFVRNCGHGSKGIKLANCFDHFRERSFCLWCLNLGTREWRRGTCVICSSRWFVSHFWYWASSALKLDLKCSIWHLLLIVQMYKYWFCSTVLTGTQDWGCKSPTFPTCQSELCQTWSCSLFSVSFCVFECFLFFDSSGQNISCKPNLCSGLKAEAFETEPNMEQHHFLSEEHFSSKAVTEHFHFFHFLSLALTAIPHTAILHTAVPHTVGANFNPAHRQTPRKCGFNTKSEKRSGSSGARRSSSGQRLQCFKGSRDLVWLPDALPHSCKQEGSWDPSRFAAKIRKVETRLGTFLLKNRITEAKSLLVTMRY